MGVRNWCSVRSAATAGTGTGTWVWKSSSSQNTFIAELCRAHRVRQEAVAFWGCCLGLWLTLGIAPLPAGLWAGQGITSVVGERGVSRLLNWRRLVGLARSLWSAGGQHRVVFYMVQLIPYFWLWWGNTTVQALGSLRDSTAPAELRGLSGRDRSLVPFFYSLQSVSVSWIRLWQIPNKS